jgi:hypothetical protein
MQGGAVGFGIDRDGADAEVLAGRNDPQGDFTTIGDKDFSKHER